MIKQLIYHRITTFFLKLFCSLFYNPKYLKGKFFEKHRMGYWWAIRAIPRLYFLHRQNVNWPVGKNTMILGGIKFCFMLIPSMFSNSLGAISKRLLRLILGIMYGLGKIQE